MSKGSFEDEFIVLLRCQHDPYQIIWSKAIPDTIFTQAQLLQAVKVFHSAHSLQQAFTADPVDHDELPNAASTSSPPDGRNRASTVVAQTDRVIVASSCPFPSTDWYLLMMSVTVSPSVDSAALTAFIPALHKAAASLILYADSTADTLRLLWHCMCDHAINLRARRGSSAQKVPQFLVRTLSDLVHRFVRSHCARSGVLTARHDSFVSMWANANDLEEAVVRFCTAAGTIWNTREIFLCVITPTMRVVYANTSSHAAKVGTGKAVAGKGWVNGGHVSDCQDDCFRSEVSTDVTVIAVIWYYVAFIHPVLTRESRSVKTETGIGNTARFVYKHNSWTLFALMKSSVASAASMTEEVHLASSNLLTLISTAEI